MFNVFRVKITWGLSYFLYLVECFIFLYISWWKIILFINIIKKLYYFTCVCALLGYHSFHIEGVCLFFSTFEKEMVSFNFLQPWTLLLFQYILCICFIYVFIYVFIYFWLCWVFIAACGLSLVAASGVYSSLWCAGFSLRWLLLLRSIGCRRAGFSSCGMQSQ